MSETSLVWVDGAVHPPADALISPFDHGLTVGDGVFETMKVVDGQAFALRRHLARLRRSAAGLGLEIPRSDEELRDAIATTIDANHAVRARVRVTVTGGVGPLGSKRGDAGPTVIVAVSHLPSWSSAAAVVTVPWRRNEHSAVVGLKTTSYAENVVALEYAHERGAEEAIFANTAGDLCEGTGTNVFVAIENQLWTPPLSSGCLAGVTRELLLEAITVTEASLPLDALDRADEAFLTSSTRDVQPIASADGRPLPGYPGPLTRRAMAAFAAVARSIDP